MFEVSSPAFQQTLDRFSQFFITPLLNQNSAQKQLNAIESEHQKNYLNDTWRKFQLIKFISKDGHPFNKFSTGNKKSLINANLQILLQNFYQSNYSANLMKLAIEGSQQIQTMQKWVIEKYSQIPNYKYQKFKLLQHPFDHKAFNKLFKILPIMDIKKLQLTWILKNKKQHYKHHPGTYISNLIGHQGKGSLLSYLIKQGLGTSLSCGNFDTHDCFTELQISIDLTQKGLNHIMQIIGYIQYYIKMLKQNGCPKYFYQQLKQINKLKFQYMDKKKGMMQVAKLTKNMHQRNIQQLLIYPYLFNQWRPDLINQYFNQMTNDNLIIFCQAKQFQPQCTLQQPIYQTKYTCIELKHIQPIQCQVSLPQQNIFLPKDLTILPLSDQKKPSLIYQSNFIDTFFKKDHIFKLPKININLRFIFDGIFSSTQQVTRTIFIQMFKQSLRQFTYLAQMASIQVQISFSSYISLDIKFKGFKDSLKLFIIQYINKLFQFNSFNQQHFLTLIEKYVRKYTNQSLNQPYNIVYKKSTSAVRYHSSVSQQEKLLSISSLTLTHISNFNKYWKKKLFLQSYFAGNLIQSQAIQISKQLQKFLSQHSKPHKKQQTGQIRTIMLPQTHLHIIQLPLQNKTQQNESLLVNYQYAQLTIKSQLFLKFTQLICKQPAFDYLRTQQQLGYIVFVLAQDNRGVGGFIFLVQSTIKSTHQLSQYINIFLNQKFITVINNLNQQQFLVFKNSLAATRKQKDKNLNAQTTRYWSQIVTHKYIFTRRQQQLDIISSITLHQLKQFITNLFYTHPKRLQLHMISDKKKQINTLAKNNRLTTHNNMVVHPSIDHFMRKMPLYPDFYAPNPN